MFYVSSSKGRAGAESELGEDGNIPEAEVDPTGNEFAYHVYSGVRHRTLGKEYFLSGYIHLLQKARAHGEVRE